MEALSAQPLPCSPTGAGLVEAVLQELAMQLEALAGDASFSDAIDLHSLPLDDNAREQLRQRLGRGEVEARLDLAGPSSVVETAYAGLWWVRHADADGRTVFEQIVVARVPPLLLAHGDDIAAAAQRLGAELTGRLESADD
jgi:hydrogenase-1 operon protein HyaF